MTTQTVPILPLDEPFSPSAPAQPRRGTTRRLRAVPASSGRRQGVLWYAMCALGAVGLIVVAQLVLSGQISRGAYAINDYQNRVSSLNLELQQLREQANLTQAPQYLAQRAVAAGMVPGGAPAYLRYSNGSVAGQPSPATGQPGTGTNLVADSLLTQASAAPAAVPAPAPASAANALSSPETPTTPATTLPVPQTR